MKKLLQLLQSLSARELQRFGEYLASPIFNKSQKCIDFFQILKKEAPHYTISTEFLFEQLYPNKKKGTDINVLSSKLLKLLEGYLIFLKQEQKTNYNQHLLMEGLLERGQVKYFESVWKRNERSFQEQKMKTEEDYHVYYLWQFDYYRYQLRYRKKHQKIEMQRLLDAFEVSYSIYKLKHINAAEQIYRRTNQVFDVFLEKEFLTFLVKQSWAENPLLSLYRSSYELSNQRNDKSFEVLKIELMNQNSIVSEHTLYNFYSYAINFCSQQIRLGKVSYYEEMFNLYKEMKKKGLLLTGGSIHWQQLKNIVTIGLKAKKYEQTWQFIHDYKEKVEGDVKDSIYHFNIGAWHYYQQNFDKAQNHLFQVAYFNTTIHLNAQGLLLKIYYEKNETELLFTLAETFKVFVRGQKKLNTTRKKSYINFIKFAVQLFKIKNPMLKSRKTLYAVREDIEESSLISDKQWLLEKIDELSQ